MTVVGGGNDLEEAVDRRVDLAAKGSADQVDDGVGQMGEIADRFVANLAALAITASQQVGLVELALVAARCGDDVYGTISCCHVDRIAVSVCGVKHY